MGSSIRAHPDLLFVLDAAVRRDSRPPGFHGRICIGVLEGRSNRWWHGIFTGASSQTYLLSEMPAPVDMDVLVCMGVEEADSLLRLGGFTGISMPLVIVDGKRAVLERFAARYLRQTDLLGLRVRQSNQARLEKGEGVVSRRLNRRTR